MNKNKKLHLILALALLVFLTVGGLTVGAFADRATAEGKSSVLQSSSSATKVKRKSAGSPYRRSALLRRLLAQSNPEYATRDPFEDCVYIAPEKPEYTAEFLSKETKASAFPGEEFEFTLFVKNTGNVAWFSDFSACSSQPKVRLGTAKQRDHESILYSPSDPRWKNNERIAMVESRVNPGEIATFSARGLTPRVNDIVREYFQPVVEGQSWMEGAKAVGYLDIYIGEYDPGLEGRRAYMGLSGQASALDLSGEAVIEIDISEQKLQMKFGNTIVREYTVSTGTFRMPTPLGRFKILNKQDLRIGSKYPHYHMPFWQGFTKWGHGLHALPYLANDNGVFWEEALNHIGQRVSHGCVRMLNEDAEDLYSLTEVGMAVVIHE